ncbi:ferredoxin [Yinghuangia seranimata]|uniref:ferredoxin n=1 Tax=Yinghuangia seranimata TaxID=408067 RepID=UPI00248C498B|nr:ferredoxin [Yinghuangia seranimata]MDI2128519.1 ferredoxin [Yinghuangia seranimata]
MRIDVERELCVGAGQCVLSAPKAFAQDGENGLVVVLEGIAEEDDDALEEAVLICPAQALRIEDD